MARDYSTYSVTELEQALASIDGEKFPDNHAALQRELKRRQQAGEVDRLLEAARETWLNKERRSIRFARHVRRVVAAFLLVSPLCALAGIDIVADNAALRPVVFGAFVGFLLASVAGGVGLLVDRPWGHWLAVVVLTLQVLKIQVAGMAFSLLSLGGVFLYVAAGKGGVVAIFNPGARLALHSDLPFWVGVNFLFIPPIVYLFTAREKMP